MVEFKMAALAGLTLIGLAITIFVIRREAALQLVAAAIEVDVQEWIRESLRGARRLIILIVGVTTGLAGIAMLVLPGPGLFVLFAGLALLSTEFVWARRWLRRIRERVDRYNPLHTPNSDAPEREPAPPDR